jgi:hypothetical protein
LLLKAVVQCFQKPFLGRFPETIRISRDSIEGKVHVQVNVWTGKWMELLDEVVDGA